MDIRIHFRFILFKTMSKEIIQNSGILRFQVPSLNRKDITPDTGIHQFLLHSIHLCFALIALISLVRQVQLPVIKEDHTDWEKNFLKPPNSYW